MIYYRVEGDCCALMIIYDLYKSFRLSFRVQGLLPLTAEGMKLVSCLSEKRLYGR